MRILFLCHRIPYPPDKGDKIRSWHEVEWLARRHEVDLFTLIDDAADEAHVPALAARVRRLVTARIRPSRAPLSPVAALRALVAGDALSVARFRSAELGSAVREALARERYDVALAYSSQMAPYLDGASVPTVADFVDLDSEKWAAYARAARFPMRSIFTREARAVRALEKRVAERAAATIVCAKGEEDDLRKFAAPKRVVTISNGVDAEYFAPNAAVARGALVTFTGAMDYRANADAVVAFVRDSWPAIRAARPDARFRIVGSNPLPEVRALTAEDGVEVTGRVPDVRPHLQSASVAVAPLAVARGIQNKVLEALAGATPVVATSAALAGIGRAAPGVAAADGPRELAVEALRLLADPALRDARGRAGRAHVVSEWGWAPRLSLLEQILREASVTR